jgi:hypothetical protein
MFEPSLLSTPKALAVVKKTMADLKPFSDWLKTYLPKPEARSLKPEAD